MSPVEFVPAARVVEPPTGHASKSPWPKTGPIGKICGPRPTVVNIGADRIISEQARTILTTRSDRVLTSPVLDIHSTWRAECSHPSEIRPAGPSGTVLVAP